MRKSTVFALACFAGALICASMISSSSTFNNTIGGVSWDTTKDTEPVTITVGAGLDPEMGWFAVSTRETEPTGVTLGVVVTDPDGVTVLEEELIPRPDEIDFVRLEPIPSPGLYNVKVTSPPGVVGKVHLLFKPSTGALVLFLCPLALLVAGTCTLVWQLVTRMQRAMGQRQQ